MYKLELSGSDLIRVYCCLEARIENNRTLIEKYPDLNFIFSRESENYRLIMKRIELQTGIEI